MTDLLDDALFAQNDVVAQPIAPPAAGPSSWEQFKARWFNAMRGSFGALPPPTMPPPTPLGAKPKTLDSINGAPVPSPSIPNIYPMGGGGVRG